MLMSKIPLLLPVSQQYIKDLILHSFIPLSGVAHYLLLCTADKNQVSALLACGCIGCASMPSFSKWSFPTDLERKLILMSAAKCIEGAEQLFSTNLSHIISRARK